MTGKTGRVWMVLLAVPGEVGVGYPGESKVVLLPENNKQTKTTQRELLGFQHELLTLNIRRERKIRKSSKK